LTNTQKKSISKYSRYLCDFRTITTNLTNVLDVDITQSNISTIREKLDILTECYAQCSIVLDQFSVLWRSLPETTMDLNNETIEFDSVISNSPIVLCYKNSDEWREINKKINSIISNVNKHKTSLLKLVHSNPKQIGQKFDFEFAVSQSHIDVINETTSNLEDLISDTDAILQKYQFKSNYPIEENYEPQHPILRSIVDVNQYLKDTIKNMEDLNKPNDVLMEDDTLSTLRDQTEDIVATILLVIQSVYKKHLPKETNENVDILNAIDEIIDKGDEEKEQESKDILEDKHLKEHLQDKLSNDAKLLQLDTLVNKTQRLFVNYTQYVATLKDVDEGKQVVLRLVPMLEQIILFVQYFVSQKVAVHRVTCKMLSVLLKIFSDLSTKGYVFFFYPFII
jgi:hypothetical protein